MAVPINASAASIDLGPRFFQTTAVTGSPALAAETIVATLTTSGDIASTKGVFLTGSVAYTVGTSGVSARYVIRRTDTSGTIIFDSGVTTAGIAATKLVSQSVTAFDSAPTLPGQVYVLTLTIGSGAAVSTVSAVNLLAVVV